MNPKALGAWGIVTNVSKAMAIACFCVGSVNALTLTQAYDNAQISDARFRAGINQGKASEEQFYQARAALFPQVAAEINNTKTRQNIVSSDNTVFASGETSYTTKEWSVSLTQSIYDHSRVMRYKQAGFERIRIGAETQDLKQALILRVAETYFNALAEHENYNYIQTEIRALNRQSELVEAKLQDGLANRMEALDARARQIQGEFRSVEASNRLRNALNDLKAINGVWPAKVRGLGVGVRWYAVGSHLKPINHWVQLAYKNNALVKARLSAVDVAMHEIKAQRGAHFPTLELVLSHGNRDTGGTLFGGGSEVDNQDISIRLKVPLYSGGAVSSKVRESLHLYNKTKDELRLQMMLVEREVSQAYDGQVAAMAKSIALAKSVEAFELSLESKRIAFDSGLISNVTVLDGERDLYLVRSELSTAKYEYLMSGLRLKKVVGTLAADDVTEVNARLDGKWMRLDLAASVMSDAAL
jgi:outer membrane protein